MIPTQLVLYPISRWNISLGTYRTAPTFSFQLLHRVTVQSQTSEIGNQAVHFWICPFHFYLAHFSRYKVLFSWNEPTGHLQLGEKKIQRSRMALPYEVWDDRLGRFNSNGTIFAAVCSYSHIYSMSRFFRDIYSSGGKRCKPASVHLGPLPSLGPLWLVIRMCSFSYVEFQLLLICIQSFSDIRFFNYSLH